MKMNQYKLFIGAVSLLTSSLTYAGCLSIVGTIETQTIGATEQVGSIRITSTSLSAFRRAFGHVSIEGGIKGTIVNQTPTGQVYLDHQFGFPGVGSLTSVNDTVVFTGPADAEGNIPVTEAVFIQPTASPYSGAFAGWTFQNVVAKGTVNFSTGENEFTVTGSMCR